jgi:NAD(P)-dependent dehydrogenase (short-subunit alcohol dehydrogenase family)
MTTSPAAATPTRVVIVGASSGLGRSLAIGLGATGDRVALLARRKDRLDEAAAEAGPGAAAIACDVTDPESCRAAIAEAATTLGGIDALIYSSGIGRLEKMENVDPVAWANVFATNVTGAAVATAAALPHLIESKGVAAYLSSVSASLTAPWPGLGSYAVSKAALDKMIEAFRCEHSDVGFTRVIVGDCGGGEGASTSEFPAAWDAGVAADVVPEWVTRNLIAGALVDVEELIRAVGLVIRCGASASIESITIAPRRPKTS